MKRLILFRHAKTELRAPSGDDFDRRLTSSGLADATRMGRRLAGAFTPSVALISPAVRARQTWEAAALAFGAIPMEEKPILYAGGSADVMRLFQARGEETVIVVGHNPTLCDLALALLEQGGGSGTGPEGLEGFPPAAAAVFDLSGPRPQALGFLFPNDPREGAAP